MEIEQNDAYDRMFRAVENAVLGLGSMAQVAKAAHEAFGSFGDVAAAAEQWPEVVLEDILDAEYLTEE
jgi:hypothetical protein